MAGVEGTGTAIVLSGVSSAGKTSIGRALQRRLRRVAVFVPADDLDLPRPSRALDGLAIPDLLDLQDRLESLYFGLLAAAARRGFHAIGEVFLSSPAQLSRCRVELAEVPRLLVRVTTPAGIAERRERQRGDRHPGTVKGHLANDHLGDEFDLVLDTAGCTPEEAADRVVRRIEGRDGSLGSGR